MYDSSIPHCWKVTIMRAQRAIMRYTSLYHHNAIVSKGLRSYNECLIVCSSPSLTLMANPNSICIPLLLLYSDDESNPSLIHLIRLKVKDKSSSEVHRRSRTSSGEHKDELKPIDFTSLSVGMLSKDENTSVFHPFSIWWPLVVTIIVISLCFNTSAQNHWIRIVLS